MVSQSLKAVLACGLFLTIGLTACQEGVVDAPVDAPVDTPAEQTTAKALLDRMDANGGLIVLTPDEYELFDYTPVDLPTNSKASITAKAGCNAPETYQTSTYQTTKSFCAQTETVTIDNVPFKRVSIDAGISSIGFPVKDGRRIVIPSVQNLVLESTTTRGDGVLLQDESDFEDGSDGSGSVATDFVAAYPAADTFTFSHTSNYSASGISSAVGNDTETRSITY